MKPAMIAVDWGSTSARAYLLNDQGKPSMMRSDALGVRSVPKNGFDSALDRLCGPWLQAYPDIPIFASGMIGSRNGWRDVPYVNCPTGLLDLAQGLASVETSNGRLMHIVPGVQYTAPDGLHDVMRSEETQIFGVLPTDTTEKRIFILPGTHCKWVLVDNEKIVWFKTFITGELFDVLRTHSLLCQVSNNHDNVDAAAGPRAFINGLERGLEAKTDGGSTFSSLFGTRTLGLIDGITQTEQKQYLSGLLIGGEIADGTGILQAHEVSLRHVTLIGDLALCELYREGLTRRGFTSDVCQLPAAANGLWTIAAAAAAHQGLVYA